MAGPWSAGRWAGAGAGVLIMALALTPGTAWIARAEPAGQEPETIAQYNRLCAPCHGETGHGDGPAAVAFTPRPASFADSAFQAARTDSALAAVIADGKSPMPAFGEVVSASAIDSLVAYIRRLGEPE
jgi:mono/diheme cytochrome c family protein